MIAYEEDDYDGKKIHPKKKSKTSTSNDGYFIEKARKQKRRRNKYRDKRRYEGKYDGWN